MPDTYPVTVLGAAYDARSSYLRGAADAPPLIRQAFRSDSANTWAENGLDIGQPGLLRDAGDLRSSPGADDFAEIEAVVGRIVSAGERPLILGGDHSITFPSIKAVSAQHPRLNILHIDAHPDLYDHFEGDRLSHACPFARIMEAGLAQRLVQIGIRTLNAHQRAQASRFGVEIIEMRDWHDDLVFTFDGPLYLSLDMDGLDPAFAPGVSHLEPGGFSTRQVLRVIQSLRAPLVGADLVEFNPRAEQRLTAMTAAKLFKELAAALLTSG
jgi:agmatinase